MIAKKSKKANLEKKRFGLFLLGMVSATAFALAAFEWKEVVSLNEQETVAQKEKVVDINDIPIDYVIMPKVQPPMPKPQVERSNTFDQVDQITEPNDNVEDNIDPVDVDIPFDNVPFGTGTGDGPIIETGTETFTVVQNMPEYPGGSSAMMDFLGKQIKYPPMAREANIQGKVYVEFIVEKDGSITDVKILRDIGGGCGKEVKRVINKMPDWKPGEQRGQKVRVRFTMPVKFSLDK